MNALPDLNIISKGVKIEQFLYDLLSQIFDNAMVLYRVVINRVLLNRVKVGTANDIEIPLFFNCELHVVCMLFGAGLRKRSLLLQTVGVHFKFVTLLCIEICVLVLYVDQSIKQILDFI